ncbi:MAG: hypothetical protein QOH42_2612, partial [Blastocatellia bacterium]|nr:hypothetical protein [Blastocatellia bacterium]
TVQDFWDEFSDASMPATQRLNVAAARRPISSDLSLEAEVITAPPPRPRFETSRELQYQHNPGNGATRPKIVVPIAGRPSLTTTPAAMAGAQGFAAPQQLGRVTVPVAARNGEVARNSGPAIGPRPRKRSRDFVVGLILVLCFAGLLIATGAYVRKWIKTRTPTTEQTPPTGIVGRDALTTTDLNLRDGPNVGNNQIGVAEAGSKVRVLSLNNNWCEVQVIQHSRPKDDPTSADRGWVNKRFLKFD